MKKIIIVLFIFVIIMINMVDQEEKIIIPSTAIRYRIIANSNDFKDQEEKLQLNELIKPIINNALINSKNINEARTNIIKTIPLIEKEIELKNNNYDLNYGINYFPEKTYDDVLYPEGEYESLVITLGKGLGDNWWCVLFPPLCLLEAEENDLENINYSFYVKEVLKKFY
ncbi:MAG: stage II sporulation protein R [Firmicutes bacterium]|nr:stage II sporulation protein R [Bacillota bacterium]